MDEVKKPPFGRRAGGYVRDMVEIGRALTKPRGKAKAGKRKFKDTNRKLLKFITDKEKEYMETIINSEEDVLTRAEHTSESLLHYLQAKFGTKTSGKEFKPQDVYQYTYRGYLPKQYGGNKLHVTNKIQGIVVIRIEKNEEGQISQYKEKRGRKKTVILPGITDKVKNENK